MMLKRDVMPEDMYPKLFSDWLADNVGKTIKGKPQFGGAFESNRGNYTYIEKVIYQEPATIVFWSDGTKTMSKCSKAATYNCETGLLVAVLKKITSDHFVSKLLTDWTSEIDLDRPVKTTRTLKDVRKLHRNNS